MEEVDPTDKGVSPALSLEDFARIVAHARRVRMDAERRERDAVGRVTERAIDRPAAGAGLHRNRSRARRLLAKCPVCDAPACTWCRRGRRAVFGKLHEQRQAPPES